MQQYWISRHSNTKCILFFNGWGMDLNIVKKLEPWGYDVCMYYNYRNFAFNPSEFAHYKEVYVIAWSLGVWAAAHALKNSRLNIVQTKAFNGTLNPIDKLEGIPEAVFNKTLENWDETTRLKFDMRQFGGREAYQGMPDRHSQRSIDDQKEELMFFQQSIAKDPKPKNIFKQAIIGTLDWVFPSPNQMAAWSGLAIFSVKNIPHDPFAEINSWEEVVNY